MTEKHFKINTSEIGYIYIDNPKGEHMSWVELEKTLNRLYTQNKELFKENKKLKVENEQLRKEKIDAEVKLYSANEKILMQMDYDEIIKQNTENEIEITNLKKENEQLKKDGLYWGQNAEARLKEIDKLRKDNSILKQQRDYLFDVIDAVLPHSGSTTVYNRMRDIGDLE